MMGSHLPRIISVFISCVILTGAIGDMELSGSVINLRLRGCWFEPHRMHCVVSISKTLYPLLSTVRTKKI